MKPKPLSQRAARFPREQFHRDSRAQRACRHLHAVSRQGDHPACGAGDRTEASPPARHAAAPRAPSIPTGLSALILILLVFGAIGSVGFAVSLPASGWIARAPESLPILQEKLAVLREPLDFLQRGLRELENVTSAEDQDGAVQTVTVKEASGLPSFLPSGTATCPASSRRWSCSSFRSRPGSPAARLRRDPAALFRQAAGRRNRIRDSGEHHGVSADDHDDECHRRRRDRIGDVGLRTRHAPALAVTAFLLNYIPILGPMAGLVIFFIAGVLSFGWPVRAGPAGILSSDPYRGRRDDHPDAARQAVHAQPGSGDRVPLRLAHSLGNPGRIARSADPRHGQDPCGPDRASQADRSHHRR